MFRGTRGPRLNRARRFSCLVAITSIAALACGVPIAAEQLTPTAVTGDPGAEIASVEVAGLTTVTTPDSPTATPVTSSTAETLAGTLAAAATPTLTPVTAAPLASAPAAPTATLPPRPDMAAALATLNAARTANGRTALRSNTQLTLAADRYARLMAERNFFGHDGPDGSSPQSRLRAAGYTGAFKGEALAAGQPTTDSVISVWLASRAHVGILLEPMAVEVGIGYYYQPGSYYGHYWVLLTGAP